MTELDMPIKQQLEAFRDQESVPLFELALLYASLDRPDVEPERYRNHLKKIAKTIEDAYRVPKGKKEDAAEVVKARIKAVRKGFFDELDYSGDEAGYENPENVNLFSVIDRRKGLPVALGILIISALRQIGWDVDGLNFPGHFLVRLEYKGQREIIDPFYRGQGMPPNRLRDLAKALMGQGAELHYDYFTPMSNRDIVVRLRNNVKTRLIAHEDYEGALHVVESLLWLAPDEIRLYLDGGVLAARVEMYRKAVDYLTHYADNVDDARAAAEARDLLYSLQNYLQ